MTADVKQTGNGSEILDSISAGGAVMVILGKYETDGFVGNVVML